MQSPSLPASESTKRSPQLPLPTTLTTSPSAKRPHVEPLSSSASNPFALSSPSRSVPPLAHRQPDFAFPTSPTSSSFAHQFHSTHAGGIQPSLSFFRPSRPVNKQELEFSRPNSIASAGDVARNSQDPEFFQLSDVNHRPSDSSDDHIGNAQGADQTYLNAQDSSATKKLKRSREPLLPLVDHPSTRGGRPSLTRDRSGNFVPKSIVRTSFDRVMGLRRGLSFDSIRHSRQASTERRPTLEGKQMDDQARNSYEFPTSPTRYQHPSSAGVFGESMIVDPRHSGIHTPPSPSPDLSFIPRPPNQKYPLCAVPIINPSSKKPYRKYELHPSNNKFFLNGHILTGGDSPWAFITSFLLVLTISGVWFGTTCVWWWNNESPAVAAVGIYMSLLVISTMLTTAASDPGILPRELDPEPPLSTETPSDSGSRLPMPRDLKVRNDVVRTKYCPTCETYRPPRSSHCKMCNNCVDGCDHHCQWVNNCVGRRNYATFFVLLTSATLTLILIICTSALHLYFLTSRENLDFRRALQRGAGSAVAFSLSIIIIWPVAALLSYHMRLLLLNITTIEQIRNQAHKTLMHAPPPNPFTHGGWRRNLANVLCRPAGYSWLDGPAIATEDKREINPGLLEGHGDVWDGSHH